MTDERRREVAPEIVLVIHEAVMKAFEENAHRCLLGFSHEDKEGMVGLNMLLKEYPPAKLRESFQLMKTLTRARNTAGNIVFVIIIAGLSIWGLSKIFPGVNWK